MLYTLTFCSARENPHGTEGFSPWRLALMTLKIQKAEHQGMPALWCSVPHPLQAGHLWNWTVAPKFTASFQVGPESLSAGLVCCARVLPSCTECGMWEGTGRKGSWFSGTQDPATEHKATREADEPNERRLRQAPPPPMMDTWSRAPHEQCLRTGKCNRLMCKPFVPVPGERGTQAPMQTLGLVPFAYGNHCRLPTSHLNPTSVQDDILSSQSAK